MEISNNIQTPSLSSIQSQLNQKYGELAQENIKAQKALYEKNDYVQIDSNNPKNLDEKDYERVLEKFKSKDAEVKQHEESHTANGVAKSTIKYNYQTGPDGKLYAVGGEVKLDTSLPSDEKQAIDKLEKLASASSAPSQLSAADSQIAIAANLNKMLLLSKEGDSNADFSQQPTSNDSSTATNEQHS